jgi:hypothetical protein
MKNSFGLKPHQLAVDDGYITPDMLTDRQRRFAELVVAGGMSYAEAARKAGYPAASAGQTAHRLMSSTADNRVAKYVRQLRNDLYEKYAITLDRHLTKLAEIRDKAIEAGQFAVAASAEKSRGQAAGLYIERKEVTITRIDQMSHEEVLREIARMQSEIPELARINAPVIDLEAIENEQDAGDLVVESAEVQDSIPSGLGPD